MIVAGVVAYFALPSISTNWSRGMEVYTVGGRTITDLNEVTNGRYELWRLAWRDIQESPLFGHGRQYWSRVITGHEHVFMSHPHSGYLEVWMEYGLFGLLAILLVFGSLLAATVTMLRKGSSRLELAVGLGGAAALLTHFVVGIGGRAFLPRISAVIAFSMCALAMRVYVDHRAMLQAAPDAPGQPAARRVKRILRRRPVPGVAGLARRHTGHSQGM
jgi:O-antigen ligase